ERNRLQFQLDVVDEQVDATFEAFQGLTVSCARCHDHKFDPIPQRDYYAVAGIFRSTQALYGTIRVIQNNHATSLVNLPEKSTFPQPVGKLGWSERSRIEDRLTDLKKTRNELLRNRGMNINQFIGTTIQIATLQGRLDLYAADGTPKSLAMGVRDSYFAGDS